MASPHEPAGVIATVAQLPLGWVLIFGNAGIRRLILRVRYGKDAPTD